MKYPQSTVVFCGCFDVFAKVSNNVPDFCLLSVKCAVFVKNEKALLTLIFVYDIII